VPVWNFDGTALPEFNAVGAVAFKQPGPRRPDYPRFEQKNEAVTFDGKGAHLEIKDTGSNSLFDFKNGDAITLEAWVKPDGLRKGENAYIIGKGRTDPKSANPSNQNWALRLRVLYDSACLNFLFASQSGTGIKWHRWTTPTGFTNDRRWHHVAVRYEFGKPESIRGWIDGKEIKGSWDMDGETTDAPVVDDAPVWIGSSMGGLANSSFRGAIDDIRLHRTLVPAAEIAAHFATTLPPVAKADIAQVGPSPNAGNDSASGTKAAKAPEVVRKAPRSTGPRSPKVRSASNSARTGNRPPTSGRKNLLPSPTATPHPPSASPASPKSMSTPACALNAVTLTSSGRSRA
jgi:hypothetical protein